jgi:crotonobetainyl-CoA:carnitine CoA-transferase CaiB-like acyl-CoA transferase
VPRSADSIWPLRPSNVDTDLPLEGVRVLDFSQVLAAPLATMILGDLGADVIKVEPPAGDLVRGFAPPRVDGEATYYLSVNRNRRSVVANLRNDDDRRAIERLLSVADVAVDNCLPSRAVQLGIDAWREKFSDVIWLTVAPAASGGPLADEPSFDLLAQARSGLMGVTGSQESGPTKVGAPISDVVAGLYGCIGVLAALFERSTKAGHARRIESPLLEATIASLINQAAGYLGAGVAPRLLGNDHPNIAPYGPFATADLPILLAVGSDHQFASLATALGDDALAQDVRFSTNDERVVNLAELKVALEAIMQRQGAEYWMERFAAYNVPAAPINDVPAALSQLQIAEGDLLVDVELETGSTIPMVTSPLRLDGVRLGVRNPPPTKGQHTEELFDKGTT